MLMKYTDLDAWKKGMDLSILIYKKTKDFPKSEQFGIISQIQRAVVSIPANVAEGCGRDSKKELVRFINISLGSLNEVETFLLISKELEYLSEDEYIEFKKLSQELGRILGGFKKYLKNSF